MVFYYCYYLKIRHEEDLECRISDSERKLCSSLPYPCITCEMKDPCIYGNETIAKCKANVNVNCQVCISMMFEIYNKNNL